MVISVVEYTTPGEVDIFGEFIEIFRFFEDRCPPVFFFTIESLSKEGKCTLAYKHEPLAFKLKTFEIKTDLVFDPSKWF